MAGIFEAPRNADTLCEFGPCALRSQRTDTSRTQSWVGRKSPVPMFESRMVCRIRNPRQMNCFYKKSAVLATQAIANVIKSSFGPSGLDKMMVDDIGVWTFGAPRRAVWQLLTPSVAIGCDCDERRSYYSLSFGYRTPCGQDPCRLGPAAG